MTFLLHILDKLFSQGYKKGDVSDILTFSLRGSLPKFIIYISLYDRMTFTYGRLQFYLKETTNDFN